jgi:hypothetical protein
MNHEQIEQLHLVDRYLMEKLSAEESSIFEEHFIDCPQCIAQLRITNNFLQDMRSVAADQASQIEVHKPKAAFWNFLPASFRHPLALAFGCLMIATAIVSFFVINHTRRLQQELDQSDSQVEQLRRLYEDERQSALAANQAHKETEARQAEQLRAFELQLKEEREQHAKMIEESSRRMISEGNLPIFTLTSKRSSGPDATGSINQIKLSRSSPLFIFSVYLEEEQSFKTYNLTIFDDNKRVKRAIKGKTPDHNSALSIILSSKSFRPGYYSLLIEGIEKTGAKSPVGNYPFQIIKAQ